MSNNHSIIPRDQDIRISAISSTEDTIVLASAGSGKTRLLIDKLNHDVSLNNSYRTFAAITFTSKAANEIRGRINIGDNDIFVGTIDKFLEKEIIEPFIKLIHPKISVFQYSYQRQHKFRTFTDGFLQIVNQQIFGVYSDNIQKRGGNFKCDVALKILKNISFAEEYLKYKYQRIFVDEYQDCDSSMNNLFQYFRENLGIKLFIVGDNKQSIYQWRGASPRFLIELTRNSSYKTFKLTENFRSEIDIVDFSNAISSDTLVEEIIPLNSIKYYVSSPTDTQVDIIKYLVDNLVIDFSKKIFILVGRNRDIVELHEELDNEYPDQFKYAANNNISSCTNSILLEGIARYYFNYNYSEFNFLEDSHIEYDRTFAEKIKQKLDLITTKPTSSNIESLFYELAIPVSTFNNELESEILESIINDDMNKVLYVPEDDQTKLIITTHSAKGLEADTVIVFTNYYFWGAQLNTENNYVGITRAENNLIIVDNDQQRYKNAINELLIKNNDSIFSFDDFVDYLNPC